MPIINSIIVEDRPQVDGRRNIVEKHTDNLGIEYLISYMATAELDINTVMTDRVSSLNTQLKDAELNNNVSQILSDTI